MKNILETYLAYIQEDSVSEAPITGAAIKKMVKGDIRVSLVWSLGFLGLTAAWRAATAMFSSAHRKCGAFRGGPGKQACIAREKLKALKQKQNILSRARIGCSKTKNPEDCAKSLQIENDKINNKILLYQKRLRDTVSEQVSLDEAAAEMAAKVAKGGAKLAGGLAGFARLMIIGMLVDKALFAAWRSAAALFSSAVRKCGTYREGPDREICMSKIKMNALKQKRSVLQRVSASCPKQKNPEACKEKVGKELEKVQRDIQWHIDNIAGQNKLKSDEAK